MVGRGVQAAALAARPGAQDDELAQQGDVPQFDHVGVFTYSKRVMMTVGNSLMPLNAQGAWVVVVAHSLVLFLFSSVTLEHFLSSRGLPTIPLIPVSSSQAVVGAVIGIGLLQGKKGIRSVRWGVLGNIASGWVTTPIIAAVMCFVLLFVLQNVFDQKVYEQTYFRLSAPVLEHLEVQLWKVPHRDEFSDTMAFRIRGPDRVVLFCPDVDAWGRHEGLLTRLLEGVDVGLLGTVGPRHPVDRRRRRRLAGIKGRCA